MINTEKPLKNTLSTSSTKSNGRYTTLTICAINKSKAVNDVMHLKNRYMRCPRDRWEDGTESVLEKSAAEVFDRTGLLSSSYDSRPVV